MTSVELDVAIDDALDRIDDARDGFDDGARRVVEQLSVLAESAMKAEAPEGSGRETHIRDTIQTTFEDDGTTARVFPTKTTQSGIPLVDIITGDPTWSWDSPPPLAPLADWTDAKWGDPGGAYALRHHLVENGASSMPNPFVDDSIDRWTGDVQDVAGDEVAAALGRAGVVR